VAPRRLRSPPRRSRRAIALIALHALFFSGGAVQSRHGPFVDFTPMNGTCTPILCVHSAAKGQGSAMTRRQAASLDGSSSLETDMTRNFRALALGGALLAATALTAPAAMAQTAPMDHGGMHMMQPAPSLNLSA